jgi:hypothetical protein
MSNWYIEELNGLYPNEQILDFRAGTITELPSWLPPTFSLLMGAGDHAQIDDIPNVDYFTDFQIFVCLPEEDKPGILRANVESLLIKYPKQKCLVFFDIFNPAQLENFLALFGGRCNLIDGHIGHTVHFTIPQYVQLLAPGGRALDIFESHYESIVRLSEFQKILEYDNPRQLPFDITIRNNRGALLSNADISLLIEKIIPVIGYTQNEEPHIELAPDVLPHLEAEEIGMSKLRSYQVILQSFLVLRNLPLQARGRIEFIKRSWIPRELIGPVIIKEAPALLQELETIRARVPNQTNKNLVFADKVYTAILNNITKKRNFWKAKYRTLRKHLNTKLKPKLAGGRRRKTRRRF